MKNEYHKNIWVSTFELCLFSTPILIGQPVWTWAVSETGSETSNRKLGLQVVCSSLFAKDDSSGNWRKVFERSMGERSSTRPFSDIFEKEKRSSKSQFSDIFKKAKRSSKRSSNRPFSDVFEKKRSSSKEPLYDTFEKKEDGMMAATSCGPEPFPETCKRRRSMETIPLREEFGCNYKHYGVHHTENTAYRRKSEKGTTSLAFIFKHGVMLAVTHASKSFVPNMIEVNSYMVAAISGGSEYLQKEVLIIGMEEDKGPVLCRLNREGNWSLLRRFQGNRCFWPLGPVYQELWPLSDAACVTICLKVKLCCWLKEQFACLHVIVLKVVIISVFTNSGALDVSSLFMVMASQNGLTTAQFLAAMSHFWAARTTVEAIASLLFCSEFLPDGSMSLAAQV
ncbi:OLC1v1013666C1 [Oldenlandia corymbosa var. corymbosa]|uniref:OLC1v1013666C1 n=1 Tax=Oldenlandia corymbosa var. corymbosa TaxID=529605 RepID=A0AAV1DYS9_OLDCO|nr:OLC1v1013666C1 [Oldenlandia corymbosa var. corymbosa]